MTYWQKLRFIYMLVLIFTQREQAVIPRYMPYIEDEPLFIEDDEPLIEPFAYTALKVADLMAGVKGLKTL